MTYLDKYPHCVGCPVFTYCGKVVSSIRLCNSYKEEKKEMEEEEYNPYADMTEEEYEEYETYMDGLAGDWEG